MTRIHIESHYLKVFKNFKVCHIKLKKNLLNKDDKLEYDIFSLYDIVNIDNIIKQCYVLFLFSVHIPVKVPVHGE